MDPIKEESISDVSTRPTRVQLQDVHEFMEEHAALAEKQKALEAKKNAPLQPKKKAKRVIDVEALAAEQRAAVEMGSENWTGKLTEYRAAHPTPVAGLKFLDEIVGDPAVPRFTCTAVITEAPHQFGGSEISFSNKKAARHYASKKAVDWLIENNHMPADGSVKFPKVVQSPAERRSSSGLSAPQPTPTSYAGQVPGLCHRLGFSIPKYEINPVAPNTALYDAWADFGADPRIEGKVGEIKNVYGKKNAKEEVARVVISFLQDIERQRMAEFEDNDRKRKRSSESAGGDVPDKAVKV